MMLPKARLGSESASTASDPYLVQSNRLTLEGTYLSYRADDSTHQFDLSELFLPPTSSHQAVSRLPDEPAYLATALAIADRRLLSAKTGMPAPRMLSRQLYLFRHTLDWLRAHGVYRLSDATSEHTSTLIKEFVTRGWPGALDLTARWHRALDVITPDELACGFHYRIQGGSIAHIETLLQPFWRARLGWGGILGLPEIIKARIESMVDAPLSQGWTDRSVISDGAPGEGVVHNTLGWLNDWCNLPATVDRLRHRVANRPSHVAARMSLKAAGRTDNLSLPTAIDLLKASLRLLYDVAPRVVELCQYAKAVQCAVTPAPILSAEWLQSQPITKELGTLTGKPVARWVNSGHYGKQDDVYTVEQLIGAVQGACGVLLAAMNARRQREICDPHIGVRVGDLEVLDDDLGIYQTSFYIQKTYFDRHTFYINRTSADSLRCLEMLKIACAPFDTAITAGDSLFACGRRTQVGVKPEAHYAFTFDKGRTRSLSSFLQVAFGDAERSPFSTHMFRRFYAILYYHQYDHAELRALKQHLRHLDVAMTRVYVTDPASRPLAEQIRATLGRDRFMVANEKVRTALDEQQGDLDAALAEVEREKLEQAIEQVLEGRPTAGGFSRVVRKLYRQMSSQITIGADQIPEIADKLAGRGYRVRPMSHGQCHAPDSNRHLKARCERAGELAREHAGARQCHACPYHFNNEAYLENLQEDLRQLEQEAHDILLPPMQQARARFDHSNLDRLISLTRENMDSNAEHMRALRAQRAKS